jgi:hypothetical protein
MRAREAAEAPVVVAAVPAVPDPPPHLGAAGLAAWAAYTSRFTFRPDEVPVLTRLVRTVDRLAALDDVLAREGLEQDGAAHWALVESRLLGAVLPRLVASLRLPEDDAGARPQRRSGYRAPYRPAGSA